MGPDYGTYRVIRGGSYMSDAETCRSARRCIGWQYDRQNDFIGFRVIAVSEPEQIAAEKRRREEKERRFLEEQRRRDVEEQNRIAQAVQWQQATAPNGETCMVKIVDGVEYVFHWCPPGTFLMGSPEEEEDHYGTESQHQVTLTKGFWMLETPVTQEMWKHVMGDELYCDGGILPMEEVSWYDCQEFCEKLSGRMGMRLALPTEAQWEYACRAGTTTPFNFGSVLNGDKANCRGYFPYGTDKQGMHHNDLTPVRSYAPNAWGLYDMHGNIWEWCQDWYGDYPSDSVTDPTGPNSGSRRICRGGSYDDCASDCRSAYRTGESPESQGYGVGYSMGFRFAASIE